MLTKVEGLKKDNNVVIFFAEDGSVFEMYHDKNFCESVTVDDVCGDVDYLIGSEILQAETLVNYEWPYGVDKPMYESDSFTWTFNKIVTRKGYVDIR